MPPHEKTNNVVLSRSDTNRTEILDLRGEGIVLSEQPKQRR